MTAPAENRLAVRAIVTALVECVAQDSDAFAVRLSQEDDDVLSEFAEFSQRLSEVAKLISDTVRKAKSLKSFTKDVHFVTALPRNAPLALHSAHRNRSSDEDRVLLKSDATLEDLLNADFLVVSTRDQPYDHNNVTIVTGVKIIVADPHPTVPAKLSFFSGGVYGLSDGYSVNYCRSLHATEEMTITS